MLKLNWKKGIAAALAGIMSFGVLGTTLAVPAEAASHHYEDSNWHSRHDHQVEKQRHEAHERWEREHRRTEKSSKGHSTGEVTTAAILGAVDELELALFGGMRGLAFQRERVLVAAERQVQLEVLQLPDVAELRVEYD